MNRPILLVCALTAMAAQAAAAHADVTISADKRTVSTNHGVRTYTPPSMPKEKIAIFENFAKLDPKGVYMVGFGNVIGGAKGSIGLSSLATAFTPAANATVTQVAIAAGNIYGKTGNVLIHIYADASGIPGAELWSHRTHLPVFGDCCATANVEDKAGVPLTAGTQYWIGATAVGPDSTLFAGWSFNDADQVDPGLVAVDTGAGWQASAALPDLAFGVYGN